jgi:murein endopeptidase
VELLIEATAQVALDYPDGDPVFVGDVSAERGGPLPPHRYHSDGRSVDLGLFVDGRQPRGAFVDTLPSRLDVERQWALIEAFLATGRIEHVLLDRSLIDRLVGWLRDTGRLSEAEIARIFPAADADRLWAMTGIVRAAARHRDHMHVRLRCE